MIRLPKNDTHEMPSFFLGKIITIKKIPSATILLSALRDELRFQRSDKNVGYTLYFRLNRFLQVGGNCRLYLILL